MALDTHMVPAADFLRQFMKDIIHNPMERYHILEKGVADLEQREQYVQAVLMGRVLRATDGVLAIPDIAMKEAGPGDEIQSYVEPHTNRTIYKLIIHKE